MTIFPDSNKKYLSTALMREEPERPDFVAPDVELIGYHAIGRVCDVCYDTTDPVLLPIRRSVSASSA